MKNSSASTVKKAGRGDRPDVKDSIDSPAKKRKLSNRMKSSSDDAVKKAERGITKGKKETKMKVKKMEIKVEEEDADMSSDDSHSDWEEVEGEIIQDDFRKLIKIHIHTCRGDQVIYSEK